VGAEAQRLVVRDVRHDAGAEAGAAEDSTGTGDVADRCQRSRDRERNPEAPFGRRAWIALDRQEAGHQVARDGVERAVERDRVEGRDDRERGRPQPCEALPRNATGKVLKGVLIGEGEGMVQEE